MRPPSYMKLTPVGPVNGEYIVEVSIRRRSVGFARLLYREARKHAGRIASAIFAARVLAVRPEERT